MMSLSLCAVGKEGRRGGGGGEGCTEVLNCKRGGCKYSMYLSFLFRFLSSARSFRTGGIGKLKVTMIEGVDLIASDPNGEFSDTEVESGFLIAYCRHIAQGNTK